MTCGPACVIRGSLVAWEGRLSVSVRVRVSDRGRIARCSRREDDEVGRRKDRTEFGVFCNLAAADKEEKRCKGFFRNTRHGTLLTVKPLASLDAC